MRELFSLFAKRGKQETQEELPAICPYCGEVLAQRPKRKKKCPACKNPIYVRTDPETGQKILTTEESAQVMDWLELLEDYRITKQDFLTQKRRISKKFGTEATDRDVIWSLFNDLVIQRAAAGDFRTAEHVYSDMATFRQEEGKDPFHQLQQASRMELMDLTESGCTKVKTSTCNDDDVCPSCRNLERQVFKIDDALEVMPLPNKNCTTDLEYGSRGRCRCGYVCVE